jgi:hypothetical protein
MLYKGKSQDDLLRMSNNGRARCPDREEVRMAVCYRE